MSKCDNKSTNNNVKASAYTYLFCFKNDTVLLLHAQYTCINTMQQTNVSEAKSVCIHVANVCVFCNMYYR